MPEYVFVLTVIFPYKDRLEDSALKLRVREKVYSVMFYAVFLENL